MKYLVVCWDFLKMVYPFLKEGGQPLKQETGRQETGDQP